MPFMTEAIEEQMLEEQQYQKLTEYGQVDLQDSERTENLVDETDRELYAGESGGMNKYPETMAQMNMNNYFRYQDPRAVT